MPFGQLIIGSPGAGKTTYCAGAQAFLHALDRPAAVVNLDPANERRLLPYAPAVDINELISVADVMREFGLGPNGALLYCMEYLEANLDWLLASLRALGEDAYVLFDIPGQVELSTNHPSLRRILEALGKDGWRLVAVHMADASHITDASRYVALLLLSLRAMLSLELPHINVLSKVDLLGEAVGKGGGGSAEDGESEESDGWSSAEEEEDGERKAGGRREGLAFNLSYYTRAQDLSRLTDSLEALAAPRRASRFAELNARICELVEDFGLVGFETLAVDDKRSMLRLTRVIDKAGGYVYAPRAAGQASAREHRGGPSNPKDVQLPAQDDPELARYEAGSLAATAGGLLRRDGAATAAALFGTADGDIAGWGEAGDVQERWVDDRARWDAWEAMQAQQEREKRLERDVYREAGKVLQAEKERKEQGG